MGDRLHGGYKLWKGQSPHIHCFPGLPFLDFLEGMLLSYVCAEDFLIGLLQLAGALASERVEHNLVCQKLVAYVILLKDHTTHLYIILMHTESSSGWASTFPTF